MNNGNPIPVVITMEGSCCIGSDDPVWYDIVAPRCPLGGWARCFYSNPVEGEATCPHNLGRVPNPYSGKHVECELLDEDW